MTFDGNDMRMMEQAVENGVSKGRRTENIAPFRKRHIGSDDSDLSTDFWTVFSFPMKFTICLNLPLKFYRSGQDLSRVEMNGQTALDKSRSAR